MNKLNEESILEAKSIFETCVLCGELTDVPITMHIDFRKCYVEGSGQCCKKCYNEKWSKGGKSFGSMSDFGFKFKKT